MIRTSIGAAAVGKKAQGKIFNFKINRDPSNKK